ncbi:hypothetical protein QQ045_001061 [Rhodiola kirilowii]
MDKPQIHRSVDFLISLPSPDLADVFSQLSSGPSNTFSAPVTLSSSCTSVPPASSTYSAYWGSIDMSIEDEATKVVGIQKLKKEFALFETGPFEPLVLSSSEGDLPVVQARFWQLSFSRKRWVWKPVVAGGTDSLHSLMTLYMGLKIDE